MLLTGGCRTAPGKPNGARSGDLPVGCTEAQSGPYPTVGRLDFSVRLATEHFRQRKKTQRFDAFLPQTPARGGDSSSSILRPRSTAQHHHHHRHTTAPSRASTGRGLRHAYPGGAHPQRITSPRDGDELSSDLAALAPIRLLLVRWRKEKTLPPRSASGRLQDNEYTQQRSNFPARHFLQVDAASLRRGGDDYVTRPGSANTPARIKTVPLEGTFAFHTTARATLQAVPHAGTTTTAADVACPSRGAQPRIKPFTAAGERGQQFPANEEFHEEWRHRPCSLFPLAPVAFFPRSTTCFLGSAWRSNSRASVVVSRRLRVNKQSVVTPAPEEHCWPRSGWTAHALSSGFGHVGG